MTRKRAGALTTQSAALAAIVALSLVFGGRLGFGSWYAVKSAAVFAGMMPFVLVWLGWHHPFDRFGQANQITTLRAALASLVAGGIGEPRTAVVAASLAAIGAAATLLDGADGWIARRSRMEGAFGARFDMEVDALLILALSILAWDLGKAEWWVLASGLSRYAFLAAGWQWPWVARPLPPSRRRQTICVIQIVGLLIVVSPIVGSSASRVIAAASLAALWYSFYVDVVWLWRRGRAAPADLAPEAAHSAERRVS